MAVTFAAGQPLDKGEPTVIVAPRWEPTQRAARARSEARELAEYGFRGLWQTEADEHVADAARRAGVGLIVDGLPAPSEPHVLAGEAPTVTRIDSVDAAYAALCRGARVIVGDFDLVDGVAAFLELAEQAPAWEPRAGDADWLLAGAGDELVGFSPSGADLTLDIQKGQAPALHWIEPDSGAILGVATPTPGERHVVRGTGVATAFYLGPNRYEADDTPVRPE